MIRIKVIIVAVFALALVTPAYAAEVTIRPFLIDEVLKPRDEKTNIVTIKNDYTYRKVVLFATVNEIALDADGEIKEFVSPVMTDRTNTVTSWIEVQRSRIEIVPEGTTEVPLTLRIHPYVEPGEYHAFIGFVEAPNRPEAEKVAMRGDANGVVLKVTISDQREDNMRIGSFLIDRFVTGDDNRTVSIELENTGDIASPAVGEVIFYNSRGEEVSAVEISSNGEQIAPGETKTLTTQIPFDNELGRYKANVALKYGESQRAALYDTTFFYMMPLHMLLLVFASILFIALLVALLFRKVFASHDYDDHDCEDVVMYVNDGHYDQEPHEHDIDLKNTK